MTLDRAQVTGLLLAGEQFCRMSDAYAAGRGDKGLPDIGGKPRLGHVIERFKRQVGAHADAD